VVERQDDPRINGDMILVRRIPPHAGRAQWDETTGIPTPSSQNFRDANDELSVSILAETSIEAVLHGHEGFGLVQFKAAEARAILTGIAFCRDEPPPAHVILCGKITGGMSTKLKKIVSWVPGYYPARPTSPPPT
jgi:hypothetical protein